MLFTLVVGALDTFSGMFTELAILFSLFYKLLFTRSHSLSLSQSRNTLVYTYLQHTHTLINWQPAQLVILSFVWKQRISLTSQTQLFFLGSKTITFYFNSLIRITVARLFFCINKENVFLVAFLKLAVNHQGGVGVNKHCCHKVFLLLHFWHYYDNLRVFLIFSLVGFFLLLLKKGKNCI